MSIYLALPLAALFVNTALALVVLRTTRRKLVHRVFVLFLLAMGLWGLTIYGMRSSSTLASALVWERWVFTFLALAPVLYLHFALLFLRTPPQRWILIFLYGSLAGAILLVHSGPVVLGMQERFYGKAPIIGPLFAPYVGYVYFMVALAIFAFGAQYRHATSGEERNRVAYLIAAPLISVLGATTDYMAALGVPIYPLGIASNIAFAAVATVAIVKHDLFDVHLVLRRTLGSFTLSALLAGIYSSVIAVLALTGMVDITRENLAPVALGLAALLIISALLPPLRSWAFRTVDRLFYRERWHPMQELRRFSGATKDITDLGYLASSLTSLASRAMKAKHALYLAPAAEGEGLQVQRSVGIANPKALVLPTKNPLFTWLRRRDRPFTDQELQVVPQWQALSAGEREVFDRIAGELFVPLRTKGVLAGLLILGPRAMGKPYSPEDIDLLQTVAHQAATSMENARLYEQLRNRLEELKLTQAQLVRSAKLAAVGELAATVAHEVNNPLQTILNLTYLLNADLKESPVAKDLQAIEGEVLRARKIVRGLLDFAHGGEAAWDWEDLNKLLDEVLNLARMRSKEAGVEVVCSLEPELPPVWADGEQLKQVLYNLISNALDAVSQGGVINISTHRASEAAIVKVTDNGSGIPVEHLERIFEPFFTTKPPGQGTGLGLAVSQRIVERHGGSISVSSRLGGGSSFSVSLPVTAKELERVVSHG